MVYNELVWLEKASQKSGCRPVFCFLIINKNKMEEVKKTCDCPECEARKQKEAEYEEMALAVLVALVPLMVLTLFGQVGLI
jgi:hypothetical protein